MMPRSRARRGTSPSTRLDVGRGHGDVVEHPHADAVRARALRRGPGTGDSSPAGATARSTSQKSSCVWPPVLDRFERDRATPVRSPGCAAEAERVVEVGPVDRDVVETIVLAGERHAAGLRRQARDVADAAGDRRQRRDALAAHRRRRAGARRTEHRVGLRGDRDRLLDARSACTLERQIGRDAEVDRDVLLRRRLEGGARCRCRRR